MEKLTTKIDGQSSKEFVKGSFVLDYVALGVSALCVALYIVFGINSGEWLTGMNLVLLIVSILLIVLSVSLLLMLTKAIKRANDFVRDITYEFQDDYLLYEVTRNEEKIESGKLPYTDLTEYKETKNYVFVGLKNNTWFAMDKASGLIDFLKSKGITKYQFFKSKKK